MKEIVLVGLLVVSFACVVSAHVAIVYGFAKTKPRWRSLALLVLPPVAPYWAWQRQMKVRASVWVGAAALYAVTLLLAMRGP